MAKKAKGKKHGSGWKKVNDRLEKVGKGAKNVKPQGGSGGGGGGGGGDGGGR